MRLIKRRVNYFSCSKFADWIRGVKKPYALGLDEWESWRQDCKSKNPVRYWIAEKGLNKIQDIINFPLDVFRTIKNYIRNKFIDKTHVLNTKLKPGEYYEFDTKLLYGMFEEFIDFVEIECASASVHFNKKEYTFSKGRCAEAGIDYLKWSASLVYNEECGIDKNDKLYNTPTSQAISANKMLELYNWWKDRPNRPDPADISGWSRHCSLPKQEKNKKEKDKAFKALLRIEKQQENEDTKMMIELIKLRKHIWI